MTEGIVCLRDGCALPVQGRASCGDSTDRPAAERLPSRARAMHLSRCISQKKERGGRRHTFLSPQWGGATPLGVFLLPSKMLAGVSIEYIEKVNSMQGGG